MVYKTNERESQKCPPTGKIRQNNALSYDNGVVMALIYSFGTHLSFKNVKELQGVWELIERYSLIILNVKYIN